MEKKKLNVRIETSGNDVYHHVSNLPKYQELQSQVKKIVESSTYMERFGYGLMEIGVAVPLHFVSTLPALKLLLGAVSVLRAIKLFIALFV